MTVILKPLRGGSPCALGGQGRWEATHKPYWRRKGRRVMKSSGARAIFKPFPPNDIPDLKSFVLVRII